MVFSYENSDTNDKLVKIAKNEQNLIDFLLKTTEKSGILYLLMRD